MEADLMLFAHLLTVSPLDAPQRVAEILTRVCDHVTLPEPYYFGEGDPSMVPWNLQTIASVTHEVIQPSKGWYFWRRGAGQESGTISVGRSHSHGVVRTRATGTPQLLEPYIRFFQTQSILLQADLTFIHFGREDRPLGQDEPEYGVRIGLSTLQLRRGLPDLPWGVVFGRPYIKMFGRDKLLSTPAADVREIGDESIYLQLSHNLDVDADAEFEQVRQAAKTHLGMDAFQNSGPVHIPDFNLETPSGPRLLGWVNGLPVTGMIAGRPIVQTDRGPRALDVPFNPGDGNP